LATKPGATDSKTRQRERTILNYLQRYCAKNDTVGFFGPVGWASFSDGAEAMEVAPHRPLLAQRKTYLEFWMVDALAAKIAEDAEVRKLLSPRLHPAVRLEGRTLHHPGGSAK